MILFGVMQGTAKTSWYWIVLIGILYFAVYYFLFSFIIRKWDLKTPGREADTEETKLYTRADVNARKEAGKNDNSAIIAEGLGGKKNISDIDCCATRLRVTVHDASLVNDSLLKSSGAAGVIRKGNGVQVVYGPNVNVVKSNLEIYKEKVK